MERTLLRFVWTHSRRDQILIVLASCISFPLILSALYVPKLIVNDALKGTEFPQRFLGLSLEQVELLVALCMTLLLLIFLNNAVKYYINISKGLTGERMLRRLRYTVFDRVTRMPLSRARNTSPGEIVQVVTAEAEPVAAFAGEIVATPVYQGGQLLVYVGFIIAQDPVLGLAAMILFPVQAYVIPKIQRIVIRLVQQRIRNVREMTAEISESIVGIEDMRLAGARPWHLARMSERLYTNFRIRYRIFLLKFAIKFANNVINNITPFFFYSFGGYLVIEGRMDLGALVAILAAYKDIAAPWRELLTYYQTYSDISARYEAIVEAYGSDPPDPGPAVTLRGRHITFERVSTDTPPGSGGVAGASFLLPAGATIAVIGEEEGGRSQLLKVLAGLSVPATGSITVGDETGRHVLERAAHEIAYAGRSPHIFQGSLRENVAYGLIGETATGPKPDDWPRREREAIKTGAIPLGPDMDWVDYARAGVPDAAAFDRRAVAVLTLVGLERELFARGLSVVLDPSETPDLAEAALRARAMVAGESAEIGLEMMAEPWDRTRFLENATLGENLLFGVPDRPGADPHFMEGPAIRRAIAAAGIEREITEIGFEAAATLLDLFGALGRETSLLDQIGLVQHSEREEYSRIVAAGRRSVGRLGRADRVRLIGLALRLSPLRHRLGVLDDADRRARIVAARETMRGAVAALPGFTAFDAPGYVPGLPLIENILGGRPRLDRRDATPSIETRLERAMLEHGMRDFVLSAGLRAGLGFGGNTLSPAQKRRIGLARAILSNPALLILDGVADEPHAEDSALRRAIRVTLPDATIVQGGTSEDLADGADLVLRVAGGHVEEEGQEARERRASG